MGMKTIKVEAIADKGAKIAGKMRDHTIYIDQPVQGGGQDTAPTALEYMFFALAGCIITIGRVVARQRRIKLNDMRVNVEGALNPDVFMGKNTEERAGFPQLTVNVFIDADISLEEKQDFLAEVDKRCPVSDNLLHGAELVFNVVETANT